MVKEKRIYVTDGKKFAMPIELFLHFLTTYGVLSPEEERVAMKNFTLPRDIFHRLKIIDDANNN